MKLSGAVPALLGASMFFSSGVASADPSIPDLTGKWKTVTYGHHHEKRGFASTSDANGKWEIKKQDGRIFYGERTYTRKPHDGKNITEGFSGVIARDGKRLYMVDHDEDILVGDILSDNVIELIMINDGDSDHNSRIGLMEIRKTK
ncbi:MAG: hypothetical protein FJZ79_03400 [Chlorobi bacterium]|nr:hypothetical protein [Chlorobiota bacterium]